ncbi:Uncharacterised protein [[Clostridium] sordellii]|uniref:DUF6773 family protein n=1 Tax=Paraclostridium sordellii TaxID=1505 RepID=UPI0005DAB709|nr:DUF6773 family protein [Paeniclostridium sordellii]CEO05552.1 Uncharacterised protein [[Clostridium] sordellii] [Paeniclostridium sordellii]
MKNVKDKDERVIAQRRKIQSDGFQLLIYALLLSVVVQQIFLQSPPSQYMAELLCLIGAGFYSLIRNLNLGNNVFGDDSNSNKSILKNALLYGLGSVVFAALLTGEKNIGYLLSYFLTFTVVFSVINYLFNYISKKKQDKIKRELDMDEDDID